MIIEQALLTELLAFTGLTTLIGEKIYYVNAPQDVIAPYIVMTKISSVREHSHQGSSGLATARFQFSIFSTTYYEAKQIAEQIQLAIDGKNEIIGTSPGVQAAILYENETDFYEPDPVNFFHIAVDYFVKHNE